MTLMVLSSQTVLPPSGALKSCIELYNITQDFCSKVANPLQACDKKFRLFGMFTYYILFNV